MSIFSTNQVYIIAELSANHGGDLEIALETVRAAKRTGANAIKLQTFTPDAMTLNVDSPDFMANPSGPWAGTRLYELYQKATLPLEWHEPIFKLADELGLDCFSSPFDKNMVDFLQQFEPIAYKVASFEITDIPLIKYIAEKQKPIIISTGIAGKEDIELAVKTSKAVGNHEIAILKCTSSYPTKPEDADLLTISDIADRFGVVPGLSDHTLGIEAPVVAVALGARVIEKHFILNKEIGGPDAGFSLDEDEFTAMVNAVRTAEALLGNTNYDLDEKKLQSRERARSLYITKDVSAGDIVSEDNVKSIRPGFGLHPKHFDEILGKQFSSSLSAGTPLKLEHIK